MCVFLLSYFWIGSSGFWVWFRTIFPSMMGSFSVLIKTNLIEGSIQKAPVVPTSKSLECHMFSKLSLNRWYLHGWICFRLDFNSSAWIFFWIWFRKKCLFIEEYGTQSLHVTKIILIRIFLTACPTLSWRMFFFFVSFQVTSHSFSLVLQILELYCVFPTILWNICANPSFFSIKSYMCRYWVAVVKFNASSCEAENWH